MGGGINAFGSGAVISDRLVTAFSLSRTYKRSEEASHREVWGRSRPDRGNSKCKGPGEVLGMFAEQHESIVQRVRRRVIAMSPDQLGMNEFKLCLLF